MHTGKTREIIHKSASSPPFDLWNWCTDNRPANFGVSATFRRPIMGKQATPSKRPRVWNILPAALRAPDITLTTFRNKLKTFFVQSVIVHTAHLQLSIATLRYINALNNNNNNNNKHASDWRHNYLDIWPLTSLRMSLSDARYRTPSLQYQVWSLSVSKWGHGSPPSSCQFWACHVFPFST